MKFKFFIIICTLVLIILGFTKSYAQPVCPVQQEQTPSYIRVRISTNDFSTLEYKEISVSSDGNFTVRDKTDGSPLIQAFPDDKIKIQIIDNDFFIFRNDKKEAENIKNSIEIVPAEQSLLTIQGLKRAGKQAAYRGILEVAKVSNKKDKFNLINVLPLEEYLRGVVPNELPVSFGLEALKAQAVAARNYALRPRVYENRLYDLCDSVQAQVYFGANTEKPLSDEAVQQTAGLLGLYKGDIILALYSSTAGGYTESFENAFMDNVNKKVPTAPKPYLKGKPDIDGTPDLSNEEAARAFYMSVPDTFDNNSRYFRWNRTWTEDEFRKEFNAGLNKFATSEFISPSFKKGTDIGKIQNIEVISRGVSGKIIEIVITTESGCWSVKKELLIRRIFTNQGSALPSGNVVFDLTRDENGNLIKIDAYGGGLGHGVGMSQYGAGYLSQKGYSFDKILKHYYDGISIGTRPAVINSSVSSEVSQYFYSQTGKADLIIENKIPINKFNFVINSNNVELTKKYLPKGKIRMPLDYYVKNGLNQISFKNLEDNSKSVKVWIEVFKADEQ